VGGSAVDRASVLALLTDKKPELVVQFGVKDLALFGSYSREEHSHGSDIDILVAFDHPPEASRFFGLQFYLEDLLGKPVDLVTKTALRSELRPFIEREAIHV
jgi:predicted nucleotidyltransferase